MSRLSTDLSTIQGRNPKGSIPTRTEKADPARSYQKARAAELNAARARRAAQLQSVEDEIPNLSGPVSLGTYKFTRRIRSNKIEARGLSGLENSHQKDGENEVTKPASNLSPPHSTFKSSSPTILPSFQPSNLSAHESKIELNHNISHRLNDSSLDYPSADEFGVQEPTPPQYGELELPHRATNSSNSIRSTHLDRRRSQASSRVKSSSLPAQGYYPSQEPSALIDAKKPSSDSTEQVPSSISLKSQFLSGPTSTTINPDSVNPKPTSKGVDSRNQLQDTSSNQGFNAPISVDGQNPELSKQANPPLPPSDSWSGTIRRPSQFKQGLSTLSTTDRRSSRGPEKASRPLPPQDFQQLTSELYRVIETESHDYLTAHNQDSQSKSSAHRPAAPKDFDSLHFLSLPDTLPTASFNLETNQWDPDWLEEDMSAQTPTNKPTRGVHSGPPSSRPSLRVSKPSREVRNPNAIVTTTKSGRPYTNPYMPIDPPSSTARQVLKEPSSELSNLDTQHDIAEIVGRHRESRYIDQVEARFRPLEQTEYAYAAESLDDPFQDQTAQIQQHGRPQSSSYTEYAVHQGTYGQLQDYEHRPTSTTNITDPNTSQFFTDPQQATYASNTGISPYHGRRSAYDPQPVMNQNVQSFGRAYSEQQPAYEQLNPRASVPLPAVRGTANQPRSFLPGPSMEKLSLKDHTGMDTQNQRTSSATHENRALNLSKGSRALPIRDPSAYTGAHLGPRRNQETLRQNLSSVVASAQGPTGPPRTVMNDPHRDRQSSSAPSPTATDSTVTESALRAEAPMFQQWPASTTPAAKKPGTSIGRRQGEASLQENEVHFPSHATKGLMIPEPVTTDPELLYRREASRVPGIPPGLSHDAATVTKNAGLPAVAIGAGNAFMNELVRKPAARKPPQEHLEDAATWFRSDPRDLSYAAAVLPYETMNKMNAEQFPLEDETPQTVGHLTDDSQDDDPSDRAGQAATPRPIGHGRPAGFTTPTSNSGARLAAAPQVAPRAPFSSLAGVKSIHDKEAMERSGRQFLDDDARAIEAMFGGVYSNLMASRNGPYDYLNHYSIPPAYAIDHNAKNNDTVFDPQWFATAPPARVGRDPRREQGEYEDPTQGSAGRRADNIRSEGIRRESGGRGGSSVVRPWGRN